MLPSRKAVDLIIFALAPSAVRCSKKVSCSFVAKDSGAAGAARTGDAVPRATEVRGLLNARRLTAAQLSCGPSPLAAGREL